MNIKRYDPFYALSEFEKRVFGDALRSQKSISGFSPAVNTREDESAYYVELDLPGVDKDDISVDIGKDGLSISGERKTKNEIKEDDYYKVESFFGKFSRSFSLPDGVDSQSVDAEFKDGVLYIKIPKSAPKVAKKIEIK